MNKRTFLKALGLLVSAPILARKQDKSPYMRDSPQDTPKAVKLPEHTQNMSSSVYYRQTSASSGICYFPPCAGEEKSDMMILKERLQAKYKKG